MKTVNILGVDYEITEQAVNDNPKLEDNNGICEPWSKRIILEKDIIKPHKMLVEQSERYKDKALRHEIIHAFFMESGLIQYTNDELLVDFLAVQLPKMVKAMREAECLDG
jgi:hypothetical protein